MKFIFAVLLAIFASVSFAQKFTDKAVKQCCDCMNKIDMNTNPQKLDKLASKCIEDVTLSNLPGLMKEYNMDLGDKVAFERIGEKIGIELVKKCPAFMEYIKKMPKDDADTDEYKFAEGKITNATKSDFITITLEELSGDIRIFYLIDYFDGAEKIITDLDTIKDKKVKIGYTSKKIFDKESNDFKERKVVMAFEYWN